MKIFRGGSLPPPLAPDSRACGARPLPLIVNPVTSCEAERSFSSLRRLKTWLRSTMTQERLNSVALCHVHQEYLDRLDLPSVVNQFTAMSVVCKRLENFNCRPLRTLHSLLCVNFWVFKLWWISNMIMILWFWIKSDYYFLAPHSVPNFPKDFDKN